MPVTRRVFIASLGLAAVAAALPMPVAVCDHGTPLGTHCDKSSFFNPCNGRALRKSFRESRLPEDGISIRFVKHYDVAKDEAPNRFDCYFDPRHGFVNVVNGARA